MSAGHAICAGLHSQRRRVLSAAINARDPADLMCRTGTPNCEKLPELDCGFQTQSQCKTAPMVSKLDAHAGTSRVHVLERTGAMTDLVKTLNMNALQSRFQAAVAVSRLGF
jgi:hypothetical protein